MPFKEVVCASFAHPSLERPFCIVTPLSAPMRAGSGERQLSVKVLSGRHRMQGSVTYRHKPAAIRNMAEDQYFSKVLQASIGRHCWQQFASCCGLFVADLALSAQLLAGVTCWKWDRFRPT